jgi:polyisoprenoid-binding protein YceI
MKKTLLFACALGLATAAGGASQAQLLPGLTDNPDEVQAGHYTVETRHTRVLFSVLHFGYTHMYGQFAGVTGALDIDPKNLDASHVAVSIPITSVSTLNSELDNELETDSWLAAAAFPNITFVSRHVTRTGPKTARIEGDMSLRGITRPIVLDATFNAAGPDSLTHKYTIGFDAVGHLSRSEFRVSSFVPKVSDDVEIIVSAAFEKAN